jgi:hypothetical protein
MLNYMSDDFCHAAEKLIAPRASAKPTVLWAAMDAGHFDLNSCLRESMILLKCFLRVMPDQQLHAFQKTVAAHMILANPESHCCGIQDARLRDGNHGSNGANGCQRGEAQEAAHLCVKNGLCEG